MPSDNMRDFWIAIGEESFKKVKKPKTLDEMHTMLGALITRIAVDIGELKGDVQFLKEKLGEDK